MHQQRRHPHRVTSRNGILPTLELPIRRDPRRPRRDTGTDSQGLVNHTGEVGKLLQLPPRPIPVRVFVIVVGRVFVGFVDGEGLELLAEAVQHLWVGIDVVGDDAEDVCGCFEAGCYDGLNFVADTVDLFFCRR